VEETFAFDFAHLGAAASTLQGKEFGVFKPGWLSVSVSLYVLGFQECNANFIAMVDNNNVQYMMKTLHI